MSLIDLVSMFKFWKKRKEDEEFKVEIGWIDKEISRSKRFGFNFGVLVVEMSHSVPRGLSKVMPGKTISFHVLQKHLRGYDKVVGPILRRYYIITPQTDKNGVNVVKQRIYRLAQEENWGDLSIGIAVYPEEGESPEALLNKAIGELL